MSAAFEFHGLQPGHSSHSHPTQSHFVEYSSHCKLNQGSGLESSSWQVNMFQAEGAPLCPHLDTESSEQKQTLGNQSGFSLKSEIKHPLQLCKEVFAYETLHLLQHFLIMWCLRDQCATSSHSHHSLPARLSAPAIPALAALTDAVEEGFKVVTVCCKLHEEQLNFILYSSSLDQDTVISNQVSLYLNQHLKALPKYINGPQPSTYVFYQAKREEIVLVPLCYHTFSLNVLRAPTYLFQKHLIKCLNYPFYYPKLLLDFSIPT